MSVRKQTDGAWLCECYPQGRQGKRLRKKFATKGEALAFERFTMRKLRISRGLGRKGITGVLLICLSCGISFMASA